MRGLTRAIKRYNHEFRTYAIKILEIDNLYSSKSKDEWEDSPIETERKYRWLRIKEQYVAYRILRELGYEALLASPYRSHVTSPIPCFGPDGLCEIRCEYFGNKDCIAAAQKSIHTLLENWDRQFNCFCPAE